jgi:hypothetical protein
MSTWQSSDANAFSTGGCNLPCLLHCVRLSCGAPQVREHLAQAEPYKAELQRRGVLVVPLPIYGGWLTCATGAHRTPLLPSQSIMGGPGAGLSPGSGPPPNTE